LGVGNLVIVGVGFYNYIELVCYRGLLEGDDW